METEIAPEESQQESGITDKAVTTEDETSALQPANEGRKKLAISITPIIREWVSWFLRAIKKNRRITIICIALLTLHVLVFFLSNYLVDQTRKYVPVKPGTISDYLKVYGVFDLVLLAVWYVWLYPKRQVMKFRKQHEKSIALDVETEIKPSELKVNELFNMENEARRTAFQIVGGVLAILGLYVTFAGLLINQINANRTLDIQERTLMNTEVKEIGERFMKGIASLKDNSLAVRIFGIEMLVAIASQNKEYKQSVIDKLLLHIREDNKERNPAETNLDDPPILNDDYQACLTESVRLSQESFRTKLELVKLNLQGAVLPKFIFPKTTFFYFVYLDYAFLNDSQFNEVEINGMSLRFAKLQGARFEKTKINDVDFTGADLTSAKFVGSILSLVDFNNAILTDADFTGVDLSNVSNLTQEQLSKAKTDRAILPTSLTQ